MHRLLIETYVNIIILILHSCLIKNIHNSCSVMPVVVEKNYRCTAMFLRKIYAFFFTRYFNSGNECASRLSLSVSFVYGNLTMVNIVEKRYT